MKLRCSNIGCVSRSTDEKTRSENLPSFGIIISVDEHGDANLDDVTWSKARDLECIHCQHCAEDAPE